MMLHVVLVKFHENISWERREEMKRKMMELGEGCGGEGAGIVRWQADWNLDRRKGYDLMSSAVFEDDNAFKRFRKHTAHKTFASEMSTVGDWVVGDVPWPDSVY